MPKAVVCRELGPPERLRLETFASAPLAPGEVRIAVHAAATKRRPLRLPRLARVGDNRRDFAPRRFAVPLLFMA